MQTYKLRPGSQKGTMEKRMKRFRKYSFWACAFLENWKDGRMEKSRTLESKCKSRQSVMRFTIGKLFNFFSYLFRRMGIIIFACQLVMVNVNGILNVKWMVSLLFPGKSLLVIGSIAPHSQGCICQCRALNEQPKRDDIFNSPWELGLWNSNIFWPSSSRDTLWRVWKASYCWLVT